MAERSHIFVANFEAERRHGLGYALIYPIAVPAVCFVLAQFLMPETRHLAIRRASQAEDA